MALINVLGGVAVLGSYAYGLLTHPSTGTDLWGGIPEAIRSPYTAWMPIAAGGYLIFTYYLFFHVDPVLSRVAAHFDFRLFNVLYIAILVLSALWMPLTLKMLNEPNSGLWMAIRLVLWVVGLASVSFVAALLALRPRKPACLYWLAVLGSIAFTTQTALIDAIVWVAYFPA
jgi:hypothetical protein